MSRAVRPAFLWRPGARRFATPTALVALCLVSTPRAQDAPLPAPPSPPSSPADPQQRSQPRADPPLVLQKETVTGGRLSDTDERRFSTASRMIFGREELDRYGDSSLGDVLKRLPGITISGTPGRGGDIRMRGLGRGYTLILINGEPAPRGFAIDSLSPDQVERIEIMRAPVAENSARAIAGTINIVLREEIVKRENEIRPSIGIETGALFPNFMFQRNDKLDKFSYNLTASLGGRIHSPSETLRETTAIDTRTGATTLHQLQHDMSTSTGYGLHVNGQLNWRLDGGDNFVLTPFISSSRGTATGDTTLAQSVGLVPAPYATQHFVGHNESSTARAFGNWRLRFKDGGRLEIKFNAGSTRVDNDAERNQYAANGARVHLTNSSTGIRDTSAGQSGKYSKPLGSGHQFGAGWEIESSHRTETASNVQDGFDPLAQYGNIEAKTARTALYAQDEWDISPLWSAYGGLRWETIRTASASNLTDVHNKSGVVSPLLHSVWKFDRESKDQVRLALTRTYRAPTLGNLSAIPRLNPTYPADQPNTPTNADSIGNPDLKPELAWGVDAAIEHYFEAGGLLSASVFRRSIDDLIRNVTTLDTVPWSPFQRWVSRPRNIGHAVSQGVELEAKFRLDELWQSAPKVNVRMNYSRFWSKVEDIPGPNNRLDQQPTWTANLGADYRMTSPPLTFGGNLNFTPGYIVTQAIGQEYTQGRKRVADVYVLWRYDAATQIRVSASNLFGADYVTANRESFGHIEQSAQATARSYRFYSARMEVKF